MASTKKKLSDKKASPKKAPAALPAPAVPPAPDTSGLEGPVFVDGFLHFSEKDLLRYELSQLKVLNALQGLGLKKREMEQFKIDSEQRVKAFQIEIADLVFQGKAEEAALRDLQQIMQTKYDLDLTQVTYDDKTGKVMLLGSPVPSQK